MTAQEPAPPIPRPPARVVVWRGLRGRCPRCGGNGVFASLHELREHCPTCGLPFVREEGYWLGAMTVAIALVEVVFAVFVVAGMLATWPDVPWGWLLALGLVLNGTLPVLLYGWSKTVWLGIDHAFFPATASEEAEAITVTDARDRDPRSWRAGGGE